MATRKKFTLAFGTLFVSTILVSCDLSSDFANVAEGLLPNLWITIAQILIFIVTAAVVIFLAYKPLKKKLEQRKDYIENNIKDSENKKAQTKQDLEKAESIVSDAQKKAGDIIQQAQKTAEQKALDEQKTLALSIENQKVQAHKDIEAERQRMLAEAHNKIVDTAIDASKKILGREVNESDNKKMVDEFIDQLGEEEK